MSSYAYNGLHQSFHVEKACVLSSRRTCEARSRLQANSKELDAFKPFSMYSMHQKGTHERGCREDYAHYKPYDRFPTPSGSEIYKNRNETTKSCISSFQTDSKSYLSFHEACRSE